MFDCPSLAPGPLLNTFKRKKKSYLQIYMIKLLPVKKREKKKLHPPVSLFDKRFQLLSSGGHVRFSAATLFKTTNATGEQELFIFNFK